MLHLTCNAELLRVEPWAEDQSRGSAERLLHLTIVIAWQEGDNDPLSPWPLLQEQDGCGLSIWRGRGGMMTDDHMLNDLIALDTQSCGLNAACLISV